MKYKFYYCNSEWSINYFAVPSYFENYKPVSFSKKFCLFFSENFEYIFVNETCIRPSAKVSLTHPNRDNSPQLYEKGIVSKINPVLWIMPDYYDDISFCWKSKTGKIVQPWDEDFDENDLECWMEGLKPSAYWKQIATEKKPHPFIIKNLPFEVKVYNFGTEMEMRLFTVSGELHPEIKKVISETISTYNHESENNNRNKGVVHNYNFIPGENTLTLRIDTGSSGISIINLLLKNLKKITTIERVELDL